MDDDCDGIAQDRVRRVVFEGRMFLQEKRNVCWTSQTNGGRELELLLASRTMRSPAVSSDEGGIRYAIMTRERHTNNGAWETRGSYNAATYHVICKWLERWHGARNGGALVKNVLSSIWRHVRLGCHRC